jgi:hypothetical protein
MFLRDRRPQRATPGYSHFTNMESTPEEQKLTDTPECPRGVDSILEVHTPTVMATTVRTPEDFQRSITVVVVDPDKRPHYTALEQHHLCRLRNIATRQRHLGWLRDGCLCLFFVGIVVSWIITLITVAH